MGPPGIQGDQGDDGMRGFNGSVGPMGINGLDAVLHLSNVDLFSSCQYFNRNCTITNRVAGCNAPAFPVVQEVREINKCLILLVYCLEF